MDKDQCIGIFRFHKFEARYDTSKADFSNLSVERCSTQFAETLRSITYVKDVCVRCGKEIKR